MLFHTTSLLAQLVTKREMETMASLDWHPCFATCAKLLQMHFKYNCGYINLRINRKTEESTNLVPTGLSWAATLVRTVAGFLPAYLKPCSPGGLSRVSTGPRHQKIAWKCRLKMNFLLECLVNSCRVTLCADCVRDVNEYHQHVQDSD